MKMRHLNFDLSISIFIQNLSIYFFIFSLSFRLNHYGGKRPMAGDPGCQSNQLAANENEAPPQRRQPHALTWHIHIYTIVFIDKNEYIKKLINSYKETIRINLPLFSTIVENKGKLILTEIFPSVQKHDIF